MTNRNIEIRSTDAGHELWATGSVGTCDYAQVLFAYGYYSLIGVVVLNVIIERKMIWQKLQEISPRKKTEKSSSEQKTA